ncbi:MAG: aryl-sulfate sulfotransferase, partial [Myxococcales bacterium]|nr:aryl-sulfate sulfotransferase [Myxococcales bacterium]
GRTDGLGAPQILDPWEGTVWTETFPGSDAVLWSHDIHRLPDGRIVSIEEQQNVGPAGGTWTGFGLRIYDPVDDEVDWTWSSQSAVDAHTLPTAVGTDKDPYHANWVEVVGDDVYVSLCYAAQIIKIDATTGDIVWKMGADGDLVPDVAPECTHGLEIVGDRLLVYDNGRERHESAASEYRIDEVAMTATRTWTWTEPGWYEHVLGDVDHWGDDVIVTQAHASWSTTPGAHSAVVEVERPSDLVVWRLDLDAADSVYRSERIDGCDLFAHVQSCPAVAARFAELFPAGL